MTGMDKAALQRNNLDALASKQTARDASEGIGATGTSREPQRASETRWSRSETDVVALRELCIGASRNELRRRGFRSLSHAMAAYSIVLEGHMASHHASSMVVQTREELLALDARHQSAHGRSEQFFKGG